MSNIGDIYGGHSMQNVYLTLLAQSIVYLLVYAYVIQINPGPYGTPKSFFFPFEMVNCPLFLRCININFFFLDFL